MSFKEELEWHSKQYRNTLAFQDINGLTRTYQQFFQDVCLYGNYFSNIQNSRIALLGGTSYLWICQAYGALISGKTVIAIDPLLPVNNIVTLLKYTDADLVLFDGYDERLQTAVLSEIENLCFRSFLKQSELVSAPEVSSNSDGEFICFTSGTSSKAKGVVIPISAIYTNSRNLAESLAHGSGNTVYTPLPFYHLYANCKVLAFLYQGRTICLGSPRHLTEEITYFNPATLLVVPTIADFVLKQKVLTHNTEVIIVSGGKCEKQLEQDASACGIFLQNIYGSSESAGGIALNLPGHSIDELTPIKGIQINLENDSEIVVDTPGHMREYYKDPENTTKVLRNGLLYTGDVGAFHTNGTFTPLGRKEDLIAMHNGDKLYCNEIEEELNALPGINECCILYIEGKIIAVVVSDDTPLAQKSIRNYNKEQPYFRKFEGIWIRNTPFPRTNIGKLKKTAVQEEYITYREAKNG